MSIYTIADLHLSFLNDKPMNIFGENWNKHDIKIKNNWLKKVKSEDTVIIPGDFSWAMYLEDTQLDFEYLNNLPGTKILLKGNHDYWWSTLSKMNKFLEDNNIKNIKFLYNNSYLIENKIIVGTRGWNILDSENSNKMIKRENWRLELSIKYGLERFGNNREIIVFMHYPPTNKTEALNGEKNEFLKTFEKYNIHTCYYGHLHGQSHKEAIEGVYNGIDYKLISADYLRFDLLKII